MFRIVVCALLLGACGGGSDDNHVDAGGADAPFVPQSAKDYCEAIEPFFCDFYVRCGRMDVATAAECTANFLESCNAVYEPRYVGLEMAGLLTLNVDGIAACKAHLDTVACDQQFQELSGPCAGMWRGTQTSGEACGFDVESFTCSPGTQCVLDLTLCGTCKPEIANDQTCTPGTDTCAADAFCDAGTCHARIPNGGACQPADKCLLGSACTNGTCQSPTFVKRGEVCDQAHRCPYLTVCTGGTCKSTTAVGGTCTNDGVCELGFCDAGTCAEPRDVGQPCDHPSGCSSGMCSGMGGTCLPRPSACFAG
ncbi:MAG TPA: hypothetical protein VGM90_06295 [Kofleriaceae bacterium]